MSIINHPLFLIARIVFKKIKIIIIITIIIIIINTEINDITLILFKFVFGRNMILFDQNATHNLGIPVVLGYTEVRPHFLRHFE